MTRRLSLRREALAELTAGDLSRVAGAYPTQLGLTLPLDGCLFSAHVYGCNPSEPPHCTAVNL